jgi:hypothetical protein
MDTVTVVRIGAGIIAVILLFVLISRRRRKVR